MFVRQTSNLHTSCGYSCARRFTHVDKMHNHSFQKFYDDDQLLIAFIVGDILFLADIFIRMNTSYEVGRRRRLQTSRLAILRNYAMSWLVLDVISSIPVDLIALALTRDDTSCPEWTTLCGSDSPLQVCIAYARMCLCVYGGLCAFLCAHISVRTGLLD